MLAPLGASIPRRTHGVADASALDAGGEVVADLPLVVGSELVADEGGNMLGRDHVHGGARDGFVQGLEGRLAAEDQVAGRFPVTSERRSETPITRWSEATPG